MQVGFIALTAIIAKHWAELLVHLLHAHTCQPSHIPRDCPVKISGVPLSRSRALLSRVRPTLRATAYAQGVYSSLRMHTFVLYSIMDNSTDNVRETGESNE